MSPYLGPAGSALQRFQVSFRGGGGEGRGGEKGEGGGGEEGGEEND